MNDVRPHASCSNSDQRNNSFAQMLIVSQEKQIKRDIGQAFLDLLQFTTYKLILKKEPMRRTPREKQYLIKLLQRQPFFKKQPQLRHRHYMSFTDFMTVKEFEQGQEIYGLNDTQKRNYIVIRGKV